jgi:hypothetical protein
MANKHTDLFETPDKIPGKVSSILKSFSKKYGEDMEYRHTAEMLAQVEQVGYTFDYYLDNIPYGLRPLGIELHELEGHEK